MNIQVSVSRSCRDTSASPSQSAISRSRDRSEEDIIGLTLVVGDTSMPGSGRLTDRTFGRLLVLAAQEVAEVRHGEGDLAALGRVDQALLQQAVPCRGQRRRLAAERLGHLR